MKIILKDSIKKIRNQLLDNGYAKRKHGSGYIKSVRGGRFHITLNVLENQTIVDMHYDKYKHNRNKKFGHSTRYLHPYLKIEAKQLFGVNT